MVYFGRVIKNSDFQRNGRIDVLLGQRNFYGDKVKEHDMKELKEISSDIKYILGDRKSGSESRAVRCLLVSGMANSPNAGMLQIPQVGSVGLVLEVINSYDVWPNEVEYFWLGGLWGLTQYPGFIEKDCKISLPNDDTVSEEMGSSEVDNDKKLYAKIKEDGGNIKDSEYFKNGQFIIKTKTCDVPEPKEAEKIDFDYDKIPGENTFILNKEKATLRHNIYEGEKGSWTQVGIEQFLFDKDKVKVYRKFENDDEETEQFIRWDKEGTEILNHNKKDDKKIKITFTKEGDITVYADKDANIEIKENATVKIGKDATVEIEGKASVHSKDDMKAATDKNLEITSAEQCSIEGSPVTINGSTVTIQGSPVTINGHLEVS